MNDTASMYSAVANVAAAFFVGLLPSLPSLFTLVKVFCILLGLSMLVHAILKLKNLNSKQNRSEMRTIFIEMLAAIALINLNLFIATGSESLFGVGMKEIAPVGTAIKTSGNWAAMRAQNIVVAILSFIQFVGYIAVAKGITELNNMSTGKANATLGKGLTHIVGGILACNITLTVQMIGLTLLPPL